MNRYRPRPSGCENCDDGLNDEMVEDRDGEWVRYADLVALTEDDHALLRSLRNMSKAIAETCSRFDSELAVQARAQVALLDRLLGKRS